MMLREGGQLIGLGMASGLVLAFAFSRVLGALLFKVRSFDPTAFLVASLVLGLVGILATLIPSVRASQVNANIALKYE
jgi:ABC-type antimicrobial peptide transport system permease subunit